MAGAARFSMFLSTNASTPSRGRAGRAKIFGFVRGIASWGIRPNPGNTKRSRAQRQQQQWREVVDAVCESAQPRAPSAPRDAFKPAFGYRTTPPPDNGSDRTQTRWRARRQCGCQDSRRLESSPIRSRAQRLLTPEVMRHRISVVLSRIDPVRWDVMVDGAEVVSFAGPLAEERATQSGLELIYVFDLLSKTDQAARRREVADVHADESDENEPS